MLTGLRQAAWRERSRRWPDAVSTIGRESWSMLVDDDIFDADYYAAQVEVDFPHPHSAALHFLVHGMRRLRAPHPLLDPPSLPAPIQALWKRRQLKAAMAALSGSTSEVPSMGPLFSPREITPAFTSTHRWGVLGDFLQRATPDTLLPTTRGQVPLGAAMAVTGPFSREALRTAIQRFPHVHAAWDSETEAAWKNGHLGDVVPPGDEPVVSVVMPVRDRAEPVVVAIRSVLAQTLGRWELIVVDDGSSDTTPEVVEELAAHDPRIALVRRPAVGVSAARNAGLARARGRYVAFLDSDNVWRDDFLACMVAGLDEQRAEWGFAAVELHTDEGVSYRYGTTDLEQLLIRNHVDLNVLVARRESVTAVGGFSEDMRRWVDHDLAIRLAKRATPHYVPVIGCAYDHTMAQSPDRISARESDSWQWVALGRGLVEWDRPVEVTRTATVVMPTFQDCVLTMQAVTRVLDTCDADEVEVIVVDNGSAPRIGIQLAQFCAAHPSVTYVRLPRNMNFGIGSNYGASLARGRYVVFLNNDTEVRPGWLEPLLERLRDDDVRAVQPLLLFGDDSIQSAGSVFLDREVIPTPFLTRLPRQDAEGVEEHSFPAITAACLAMRREDLVALRGFDPLFVNGMEDVDLCLRATRDLGGRLVVEPRSVVNHLESQTPGRGHAIDENRALFLARWAGRLPEPQRDLYRRHGYEVSRLTSDNSAVPAPRAVLTRIRDGRDRWGVRHAAVGSWAGTRWGDSHFANDVAARLREVVPQVVTYHHGANSESAHSHDDVSLVIRGLDRVGPLPDAINLIWIISHPSKVTWQEVQRYDVVCAASTSWAEARSREWGRPVVPLLQATDPDKFFPPPQPATDGPIVFVGGNFPHRPRWVVRHVIELGYDVEVYGAGWEGFIPRRNVVADRIDPSRAGEVYRSASRVLADHWSDMAELGFLQNRLFDAVACAAPVITSPVTGLRPVLGSLVQEFTSTEELDRLCSPAADALFGSAAERIAQAEEVRAHHSFAARAGRLVELADRARRDLGLPGEDGGRP